MARKKTIQKETKAVTDLDLALKVSDAIDIKDIVLTESRCKLFTTSREKNSYTISALADFKVEEQDKILLTQVHLKFKAENSKKEEVAFLEAIYLVVYCMKTEPIFSNEQYAHFADYCSVFHTWPYWREFVQRSIAGMGLPPLTLPVYKFGSKLPKEETVIQKKMLEEGKATKAAKKNAKK